MKILMLSWEYPPKNVGGLSNHVYYLAHQLAYKGNEVHVITCIEGSAPLDEYDNGVYVHRVVPYKIETNNFVHWVQHLNFAMIEEAIYLIKRFGRMDVIHVHDWLTAFAGKTLKYSYRIPMVSTIHATEYGRNNGIRTEMQKYISSVEELLTNESWKVIVCSNYMKTQVNQLFSTLWEKICVIPNGVKAESFDIIFDKIDFRRNYAQDNEKLIFYIGRHVYEKGIDILINASPGIIEGYNDVKFVISGVGPLTNELRDKVRALGLENRIIFTGYMDEIVKNKIYKVADVAIFPSRYEPFGIVALEAMAAGCPVLVSDVGGFSEIIENRSSGLTFIAGNQYSLKDNAIQLLKDKDLSERLTINAKKLVNDKYTWDKVAEMTSVMYRQVLEEADGSEWDVENQR
ncbi:glycosyltransferase family 4 protein [Clostridium sp. DL1XJH146]